MNSISGKMKAVLALCLFAGLAASKPQDTYETKYDNIDLDEILNNERLYTKYFECIAKGGKCTEDGKMLKDTIPEALKNDCLKCSEKQKAGTEKVIKFLSDNRPEDFKKIEDLYDPDQVYRKKYNEKAKKLGIKLLD